MLNVNFATIDLLLLLPFSFMNFPKTCEYTCLQTLVNLTKLNEYVRYFFSISSSGSFTIEVIYVLPDKHLIFLMTFSCSVSE